MLVAQPSPHLIFASFADWNITARTGMHALAATPSRVRTFHERIHTFQVSLRCVPVVVVRTGTCRSTRFRREVVRPGAEVVCSRVLGLVELLNSRVCERPSSHHGVVETEQFDCPDPHCGCLGRHQCCVCVGVLIPQPAAVRTAAPAARLAASRAASGGELQVCCPLARNLPRFPQAPPTTHSQRQRW